MSDALTYVYYIISKCMSFVFNDMLITTNVTVGWIYISILVFGILLGSILNIPHRIGNFSRFRTYGTISDSYRDGNHTHSESRRVRLK